MRQWLSTLALAAAVFPAAAKAAEPVLPPNVEFVTHKDVVSEYRLRSNGMPILLVERHAAPVVTFMVVYHVGSRNEAPGNTGSAHLLEHMLFNKSTEHFGKAGGHKTIQVALHEAGVDFSSTNMTTWNDRMNGFSTVPSDKLELAMQIEADRMQTAKILDSERQPEMSVVRNEYEIGENQPLQALGKAVTAAAIVAHPYHWDTIGYRSDIEGVSTEQLREHYKNFFWPDNSEALVVGDFEPAATLAMFDRYFGKMPKAPKPIPKVITVEPPQEGERRVIVSRPGNTSYLEFAWLRPGVLDPDWHALDVLANILGTGRTARMYKAMIETGQATDVGVINEAFRDPFLFQPYVQLAPGVTHAAAESTLRAVVDSIRASGVTQAEVDRAMHGILKVYDTGIESAGFRNQHQVARVVIAVHVHPRLREAARDDRVERAVEHLPLRRRQRDAEMARDVPVREQRELAPQQGVVVGRQRAFPRGELPAQQRFDRIAKQGIGVVVREFVDVGAAAEVGEQQEAQSRLPRVNARHVEPGLRHQGGDPDEGGRVFAVGRRVHRDQRRLRRVAGPHAEVAPETRIRRNRAQRERRAAELLREPGFEKFEAVQSDVAYNFARFGF